MHELSIAEALVDQIQSIPLEGNSTISSITICIGALSGVDPEALQQAYQIAAEDLPFKDASLIIENEPAKVLCHSCNKESSPDAPLFACEYCGSNDFEVITGRGLLLKSMEVST